MRTRAGICGLAGAIAVIVLVCLGSVANAQQKLILKASDVHPAGYPTVVAVENLGKKLEKATNGRLSVQRVGAMQLGGEKEGIEEVQVGAIQDVQGSVGPLGA